MDIFGLTTPALKMAEKSLDLVSRSTLMTASNIANADTPGYRAKRLSFDDAMKSALHDGEAQAGVMTKSDPRHFPVTDLDKVGATVETPLASESLNGNTVNLDEEITQMTRNNINYSAYATVAGKELGRLRLALESE